jgi:hypothetical protein
MEGGQRTIYASQGDFQESTRRGASFHADQYEQLSIDIHESRPIEEGWRTGGTSNKNKKEDI